MEAIVIKIVALAFLAQLCLSTNSDTISLLPGQPQVNFHHFSGYVSVHQNQDRALFYYFVEAETDPSSKPLVLWLNGG